MLNPPPIKVKGGDSLVFFLLAFHRLLTYIRTATLEPVREAIRGLHEKIAKEVEAKNTENNQIR